MKIGIAILYTKDWQELADIVFPNVDAYCAKHGYVFIPILCKQPYDGFEKIISIKSLFSMFGYDAIWSLDCDILITNRSIKIEDFLDEEHYAYFTRDYNGLNCGSFIIKNSKFSTSLLDAALATKGLPTMYCEQDAFREVFKLCLLDIYGKIKFLPQSAINSYKYELYPEIPQQAEEQGQWADGKSFVLHLPGIGMDKRIEIFKQTKITL